MKRFNFSLHTYSLNVILFFCFTLLFNTGRAQETRDQMMERIYKKLEQYQQQAAQITDFGALTGLWKAKDTESAFDVKHITNYKDVLFYYSVDKTTGNTAIHGFAEQVNGQWFGWWDLACKGCCPGVSWWDKATVQVIDGGIRVVANSFKMDPQTCRLTTTPDDISFEMSLMKTTNFKEYLPGKLIHVVAAPAVGSQPAQYKASVTLQWKLAGLGISYYQLAVPGQMLVNNGRNLNGEYEFLTDKPGKQTFLLIAYNSKNQPLHFEIQSITIPAIPGL